VATVSLLQVCSAMLSSSELELCLMFVVVCGVRVPLMLLLVLLMFYGCFPIVCSV
jgi:hypothetical protein